LTNVFVWDSESVHPVGDGITVLWRAFTTNILPESVSIPQLIEEQADALRGRYLTWIYEFGEARISGKRLVDHLELRPGFSYWWMTLLVEKCNYSKSPLITDAIRFLAFTDWAVGCSVTRLTLASANQPLAECLRAWCEKSGIEFEWQCLPGPVVSLSWARRVYAALPHPLQALVWLLNYLRTRWPLRGVGLKAWCRTEGRITFVSYLFNLVPEAAKAGCYESRYWAHLPEVLKHESCQTNWLHLYVRDSLLQTAKQSATVLKAFNRAEHGRQCHVTLWIHFLAQV